MPVELRTIRIEKPIEVNVILGQSHFIKTVEDLHEGLAGAVPGIRFGLAFAEASGPCLIRASGTDPELVSLARKNALAVGCGHFFIIMLGNCFPINVLRQVRDCPEVCQIFCATANPCAVIVADTELGRGVLGVIDGSSPKGAETDEDVRARKDLLRRFGYKL
jgi:hypothetical protein